MQQPRSSLKNSQSSWQSRSQPADFPNRCYNIVSRLRGLMDKALASGASNLGSNPSGDIFFICP